MLTGRFQLLAAWWGLVLVGVGSIAGCTQPGPIATHRATVGSLKASVSQLEYSNDNLKKQVAQLKSESTRFANDLDEKNLENGELSARLDDAKDVIRKQGGDVTALNRSSGSRASTTSTDDEIPPPRSSSPIRRSRGGRKPPTTQIPRIESADPGPGALELPTEPRDPGPQASRDIDDGRWLPVARGRSRSTSVEIR